ncbi:hypothetical protein GDO86_014282 [Hymenochirus boettgeri]|nr:hypothetical protein GDO86_014282 [Hymenochirus boettgeri]
MQHSNMSRAPQRHQSPSDRYTSPKGQWKTMNKWSPMQNHNWSWASSTRSPFIANPNKFNLDTKPWFGKKSPHSTQVCSKQKTGSSRDIRHYYSPSMLKDPWVELQAEATRGTRAQYLN